RKGPVLLMFGIRRRADGFFMPELPKGYRFGHTHSEPCFADEAHPPRLFPSRAAAAGALRSWLKGKYVRKMREVDSGLDGLRFLEDAQEGYVWETVPERRAEDMEIVPVQIQLPYGGVYHALP